MVKEYTRREVRHTLLAIGITVLVAIAAELTDIASFREITVAGLAVTAVRSLATAIVVLGMPRTVREHP